MSGRRGTRLAGGGLALWALLFLNGCWSASDLILPPISDLLPEDADAYISIAVAPHRPLISEVVDLADLPSGVVTRLLSGADRVVGASKGGVFVVGTDLSFPQSAFELGLTLSKGWRASPGGYRNRTSGLEVTGARGSRIVASTGDVRPFLADYLDGRVPELPMRFLVDSATNDGLMYIPNAKQFLKSLDPRFTSAPIEDLTVKVDVQGDVYVLNADLASINSLGARFTQGILRVLARNASGDPANPLSGLAEATISTEGSRLRIDGWKIDRSTLAGIIAGMIRKDNG